MAGRWVQAPNGAAVYQDDAGVHLKGASGKVEAFKPEEAADLLAHDYSGFSPATADDLNSANAAAQASKSSALGAAARHAAVGIAGGVLAPGKLVSALGTAGANALGANIQDPLRNISGRQVVNDLSAIGAHVTGGESEVAAREQREQLATDEAVHPYASTAGEIAGNVIGAAPLAGGEAALAARAAEGVGLAGRAAQVATTAGASILEGAGLGGEAASEQAWVKNVPVTAEQTLAGIGLGALFGGAGAAAGELAGPALRKLLGRGAKEEAAGLEGAALGAEGEGAAAEAATVPRETALGAPVEVHGAGMLDEVADGTIAKGRKFISGMADDAAFSSVTRGQQGAVKELIGEARGAEAAAIERDAGKFLNESGIVGLGSDSAALDRATAVKEAAGQKIGTIMQNLDKRAPYMEARPMVEKLDDMIGTMKNEAWLPEQEAVVRSLEKKTEKVREFAANGILSHSDAWEYRRALDQLSGWAKRAAPSETQKAVREARAVVESEIEKAVSSGSKTFGADMGPDYLAAKKTYGLSSWAEKSLAQRVGVRDVANRWASASDYGAGLGVLAATGGHALPALLAAGGNKLLRERGASTFAWLARKVAADSVDIAAAPAGATATARAVQSMVARSESHMQNGIGRYLGGEAIEKVGGHTRQTAAKAIRASAIGDAKIAYKEHATDVQDLASNPGRLADRLNAITGRTLPTVAPGLHIAMAAVAARAASYLSANLPAPPVDPDSITPQLDEAPPVSVADMRAYADRVEGVEDPLSLVDDLHDNDISPEKVDAVKTVWPELFGRMRQVTFDNLAQRTEKQGPVPYEQRKTLDLALDGNGTLEPSLHADSLAVMQQARQFQEQQLKQKAPRPASGGTPQLGNMLMTRSAQIASQ